MTLARWFVRAWITTGALSLSQGAAAAIDWCRVVPLLPGTGNSFAQIAAGIDQLGCTSRPSASAHSRTWVCTDREESDSYIALFHFVGEYGGEPNLLIVTSRQFRDRSPLRSCYGSDYVIRGEGEVFDSASIAVRDRISLTRGYLSQQVHQLRILGPGSIVAYDQDRWEGTSMLEVAEGVLYDIERPTYPSTRVEIAGQNLIASRVDQLLSALAQRGARLVRRDDESELAMIEFSPPVGLDGVSRVTVQSLGKHIVDVTYAVTDNEAYMTYVGLLDERYGRSTARNGQGSERSQCRLRFWDAGSASIAGEYCPATGYRIQFINQIVYDQLEAYIANSRRPSSDDRDQPRIDPDNL